MIMRDSQRHLRISQYGPEVDGEPVPYLLASHRPIMIQKVEADMYEVTMTAYLGSVEIADTDCWVGKADLSYGTTLVWDNTSAVHAERKAATREGDA